MLEPKIRSVLIPCFNYSRDRPNFINAYLYIGIDETFMDAQGFRSYSTTTATTVLSVLSSVSRTQTNNIFSCSCGG